MLGDLQKKKAKRKKKADSVGVLGGSSPSAVPRVGLEATTLSVRAQIREARVCAPVYRAKVLPYQ